jgi:hypothetical protein
MRNMMWLSGPIAQALYSIANFGLHRFGPYMPVTIYNRLKANRGKVAKATRQNKTGHLIRTG